MIQHIYLWFKWRFKYTKNIKRIIIRRAHEPTTSQFYSQNENQRELTYGGHKLSFHGQRAKPSIWK